MKIDEHIDKAIKSLGERLDKEKSIDLSKTFIVLSAIKCSAVRKEVWQDRNSILDKYRKLKDECRKQRKEIKKELKLVRKKLKGITPAQEILDSIEVFNSANEKLKQIEKGIDGAMNDVKKGYCSVAYYRLNTIFSVIFALFLLPFFVGAGFLKIQFDWLYWWIIIPFMIIPLAFGAWKVFYLKKYLQWISADNQSKLSVWLINGSTALFLIWGYFAIACFFGLVNPYYYVIPLLVLLLVKILGQIYDFFASSKIFNVTNHIFWLVLSILVAFSLVGGQIDSVIIQYFVRIALAVTCLVLTAMVLKACLLDKQVFEDYKSVLNFVIMLTLTIGITVFAGYVFFWNKNGVEQSLFSAIMSIYAAVLGGAITLGGVAWTIRRQDEIRKEDDKKKAKPIFTFNMVYRDLDTVEGKKICLDDNQKSFEFEVLAQLENSEHSTFKVEKVYHDNQWWKVWGNNVVLPNKCVYFDFNFTEDVNNLFMEIKDGLDNAYYYEIKVLYLGLIARKQPNLSDKKLHTIRELKEITLEEINERIKKVEEVPND